MRLSISATGATVQFLNEIMTLQTFANRLSWLDVPNTEEPAIVINVSDKHYSPVCTDETYRFIMSLLYDFKHSRSLQTPEYKDSLDKLTQLNEAYKTSTDRRLTTRGNVVKYTISSTYNYNPMVYITFENGDTQTESVTNFVNGKIKVPSTVSAKYAITSPDCTIPLSLPPDVAQFSKDYSRYMSNRVSIHSIELVDDQIQLTMTNDEIRHDSLDLFMIIQYTSIYPAILNQYRTTYIPTWNKLLKNGKLMNMEKAEISDKLVIDCSRLDADFAAYLQAFKKAERDSFMSSRRGVRPPSKQSYIESVMFADYIRHMEDLTTKIADRCYILNRPAGIPDIDELVITDADIKYHMTDKPEKDVKYYLYTRYCKHLNLPEPTREYRDAYLHDFSKNPTYKKMFCKAEPQPDQLISSVNSQLAYSAF
jgi:hypothetical protein